MSDAKPLLEVGSRCSHDNCYELDFLPIVCQCKKTFCSQHILPDAHGCSYGTTPNNLPNHHSDLRRCGLPACSQLSLNPSSIDEDPTCKGCNKSFCAAHRHQSSHSCAAPQAHIHQKTESARALLAKNFPATSNIKRSHQHMNLRTDPAKLTQHRNVELIKMRQRATAGIPPRGSSTTPINQRLHVRIMLDGENEKVFWFAKSTITGKVLDALANHTKLVLSNGSLCKPLANGDNQVLLNDRQIADQVEDGDLLVVTHGPH